MSPQGAGPLRLDAQMTFLGTACALKSVSRNNLLQDLSRRENSAEHSWHVALYALLFTPPGLEDADRDRAIAMLLLHDLVEIDAGDHPIHLDHDAAHIARAEAAAFMDCSNESPCSMRLCA